MTTQKSDFAKSVQVIAVNPDDNESILRAQKLVASMTHSFNDIDNFSNLIVKCWSEVALDPRPLLSKVSHDLFIQCCWVGNFFVPSKSRLSKLYCMK